MQQKSDHEILLLLHDNLGDALDAIEKNSQSIGWLIVGFVTLGMWFALTQVGLSGSEALGGGLTTGVLGIIAKLIIGRFS